MIKLGRSKKRDTGVIWGVYGWDCGFYRVCIRGFQNDFFKYGIIAA